ncbi:MAG: DMT family transporter [Pseudomonadota bacterium]
MSKPVLVIAAPALFVLLWSTGFVGARATMPHADSMAFLGLRFALSAVLIAAVAAVLRHRWPRDRRFYLHQVVVGCMLHVMYLGGVFSAIELGMPAGLSSLIVGLQPLLTVVLAIWWLRERVSGRQWIGVAMGFIGLVTVLADKGLAGGWNPGVADAPFAIALCVVALIGISVATIYQKRFCAGSPLVTGACVQYVAAAVVSIAIAVLTSRTDISFHPQLVVALVWLVLVLSVVAVMLLNWLIQQGAASSVASLFYLVPPFSALEAWWLFDETMGVQGVLGMGIVAAAVFLVISGQPKTRRSD